MKDNEHYRNRARKATYNLVHRVKHWMKQHPGKTLLDALRAEHLRAKRHSAKAKRGVLVVSREGKRRLLPVTIYQRAGRKGRGLNVLPELTAIEAMLYRHWDDERDGKPAFRTLTEPEILKHLPDVGIWPDNLKKIRKRLGLALFHPAE